MLFFCKWPARASVLLGADSRAEAVKAATAISDGVVPSRVMLFPVATFAAEVFDDGDDADASLVIDPLPHVADLLGQYEDATDEPASYDEPPAPVEPVRCASEADGPSGAVLRCDAAEGHGGMHRSGAPGAGGMVWT